MWHVLRLSIYPSVCLPVHLSTYLPVFLSVSVCLLGKAPVITQIPWLHYHTSPWPAVVTCLSMEGQGGSVFLFKQKRSHRERSPCFLSEALCETYFPDIPGISVFYWFYWISEVETAALTMRYPSRLHKSSKWSIWILLNSLNFNPKTLQVCVLETSLVILNGVCPNTELKKVKTSQ